MEDFEFIIMYPSLLEKLKFLVNERYYPVIETMEGWDPHDLISDDKYFPDETSALWYVFELFMKEVKKLPET
jgi:hypothetical protein